MRAAFITVRQGWQKLWENISTSPWSSVWIMALQPFSPWNAPSNEPTNNKRGEGSSHGLRIILDLL
jgi:hypothetical protein